MAQKKKKRVSLGRAIAQKFSADERKERKTGADKAFKENQRKLDAVNKKLQAKGRRDKSATAKKAQARRRKKGN